MPGETDPMDRLAVVEASLRSERESRSKLEAQLAQEQAKREALEAKVQAAERAEAARIQAEREAYAADVRARCKAAGVPLEAERAEQLKAALERGDMETARIVGEAFVERAQALGTGGRPSSAGQPLMPQGDDDTKAAERGKERLMAAAGFGADEKPARRRRWR